MASRFSGPLHNAAEMLILFGPPGAGKSTVTDALVRGFRFPLSIYTLTIFGIFIKKGLIAPYLVEAHVQNQVVIDAVAFAGRSFPRGGYFVVLDGVVGPWFWAGFERSLTFRCTTLSFAPALRPHLLAPRNGLMIAASRKPSQFKTLTNSSTTSGALRVTSSTPPANPLRTHLRQSERASAPALFGFQTTLIPSCLALSLDDMIANRVADQIAHRMAIEAPHDVCPVGLDCFHA
jgi:hypothetical protein